MTPSAPLIKFISEDKTVELIDQNILKIIKFFIKSATHQHVIITIWIIETCIRKPENYLSLE